MAWLGVVAALVTALIVAGQLVFVRRQGAIQESTLLRDAEAAWRDLAEEWRLALQAAYGPGVQVTGVPLRTAQAFEYDLLARQSAEVDWLEAMESGTDDDQEELAQQLAAATAQLDRYRVAVESVLLHLSHLASLVLRGDLPAGKLYPAVGVQLVSHRRALGNLLMVSSALSEGCVAGIIEEARLWRTLSPPELNRRLGWGDFLVAAPATAGRIRLLLDILAAEATLAGDYRDPLEGGLETEDLGTLLTAVYRHAPPDRRRRRRKLARRMTKAYCSATKGQEWAEEHRVGWSARRALMRQARDRANDALDDRFPEQPAQFGNSAP